MEALLAQAEEALGSGRPQLCLALAAGAERELQQGRNTRAATGAVGNPLAAPTSPQAAATSPALLRRLRQLQALARIELLGPGESWWQLLGLDEEEFIAPSSKEATSAEARKRYRQLAVAVHPDKCSLPGAAAAFQKLQRGVGRLLAALEGGGARGKGAAGRQAGAKRRRGGGEEEWAEEGPMWDEAVGPDADFGDDWLGSSNGGFPWWGEWDPPAWAPGSSDGGGGSSRSQAPPATSSKRQGPQQGRNDSRGACGLSAGKEGEVGGEHPQQATVLSEAKLDERALGLMSVEELRAEVRQRQNALLGGPSKPQQAGGQAAVAAVGGGEAAPGAPLSLQELQARLRRARSLLTERIAEEQQAAKPAGGGFFRF